MVDLSQESIPRQGRREMGGMWASGDRCIAGSGI
jgi:hypothetical protein